MSSSFLNISVWLIRF